MNREALRSQKTSFIRLTAIGVCALSACAASAQPAVPGTGSSSGALSASAPSSFLPVTDVFIGRGVVGPYLLSWRGIEPGSETVYREAQALHRDVDYKVDPKTGALTFTAPLRNRQIARVDYRYTPGKALANTGGLAQPFKFDLFEHGNGALTFDALIRPGAAASVAQTGAASSSLMLLGFGSTARLAPTSTLANRLFLDLQGGSFSERSGVQVTEKSKLRYGQFSAGFVHGGSGFKGAEETGIAAGKQVIDAAASLNPIHGIAASASFQQTTELPDKGKGNTVTVFGQKVSGTLGAGRFLATRTETTIDPAEGAGLTRTASRLQFDHKIGATTQATVTFEQNENRSEDSRTLTQTAGLNVRSQPIEAITLTGSYYNRLLASGAEDATNLRVEAAATKQLKLSAVLGDKFTKSSALHTREAAVEYAPLAGITISGSLQMRAEAGNEAVATGFSASAKPVQFLEVAGGVKLRDGVKQGIPDPSVPNTYDVKLTVGLPNKLIRITGGAANNPEDERGAVARAHNRSVAVQSTLGQFDLAGGYTLQDEYLSTRINTVVDLKLGWRLARSTQIITTFREAQTLENGMLSTDTYGLTFSHKIGSLLDFMLSGTMTNTLKDGLLQNAPDYRAEAKLGLKF